MRKLVFHIILCIFRFIGLFKLFAYLNRRKAIILAYHGVTNIRENNVIENVQGNHLYVKKFEHQIEYLVKNYNIISLDRLVDFIRQKNSFLPRLVVITMDDGYRNNYTNAFPILRRYGVPVTIFLTTNLIGTNRLFWRDRLEHAINDTVQREVNVDIKGIWHSFNLSTIRDKIDTEKRLRNLIKSLPDKEKNSILEQIIEKLGINLSTVSEDSRCMDWDEVKQMHKEGISFAAHSDNHVILTKVSIDKVREEIANSKEKIERQLETNIEAFCYPNGKKDDFDEEIKDILKNMGFNCAVTLINGFNNYDSDLFELKRIPIVNYEGFTVFLANISGFLPFFWETKEKIRNWLANISRNEK